MVNRRTDKLLRRTTMVATVTASYFLLTADYGPEPNFLDPVSPLNISPLKFVLSVWSPRKFMEICTRILDFSTPVSFYYSAT